MDDTMIEIIVKEGCPAELIREYVEGIIDKKKYPDIITLSPESIKRLVYGYVDEKRYKAIEKSDGTFLSRVKLIWHETEQFPAMELILEINKAGIWEVVSIKEEASSEKVEFLWKRNDGSNQNRVIFAKGKKETRDGKTMCRGDNIRDVLGMKESFTLEEH